MSRPSSQVHGHRSKKGVKSHEATPSITDMA